MSCILASRVLENASAFERCVAGLIVNSDDE
jgi:hypothetical protein